MRITRVNYPEFYRENRQLMIFVDSEIHRIATDLYEDEHYTAYEEAFHTIFDELECEDYPGVYIHDTFVLTGPLVGAIQMYCEDGMQETIEEMREDFLTWEHPSLTAAQRN